MSFSPPRRRALRWRPLDGEGLEHLVFGPEGDDLVARSVVIGSRNGCDFGLDYTLVCDAGFRVRELHLGTVDGGALFLVSDGEGSWRNHDGRALPEFDGCIDVDLAATPFTNTLPIRRIDWDAQPGRRVEIATLYLPLGSIAPVVDRQVYTRLDTTRFRYEAADGSFAAEIATDADGFVLDYPGLFARVPFGTGDAPAA